MRLQLPISNSYHRLGRRNIDGRQCVQNDLYVLHNLIEGLYASVVYTISISRIWAHLEEDYGERHNLG